MSKFNFLIAASFLLFLGCASAPQRDDYVKYVQPHKTIVNVVLNYKLDTTSLIDIRGEHLADDSITGNQILYQGGAGMAGFLGQIAAHSSINNSQRNEKLSQAQIEANKILKPIEEIVKQLNNSILLSETDVDIEGAGNVEGKLNSELQYINTRPIFFVAPDFEHISIKNIVWIDASNGGKSKYYQNLIEVYSKHYTPEEKQLLTNGNDSTFLLGELKNLYQQSILVVNREIVGKYDLANMKNDSFKFNKANFKRYIRGQKVDSFNSKVVIRNLRSWLLVLPCSEVTSKIELECNLNPDSNKI